MKAKIFTPMVTVFDEKGQPDLADNLKILDHVIAGGVDGIVPLGSTGEFVALDFATKKAYLHDLIQAAEGRTDMIIGTRGAKFEETIALSNEVLKHNVHGVLIIGSYYFAMDQDDFYRYFSTLAEQIEGKIYIYNYPARSGNAIDADTIARLAAKYENIAGLKDTVGDFSHTAEVFEKVLPVRPDFEVFSGFDDQFLDNVKSGGAGGISALSNIAPGVWSAWVKAWNEGDEAGIQMGKEKIDKLMELYKLESNPHKLIKEILKSRGINKHTWSLAPFNAMKEESLVRALELLESVEA